MVEREAIYAGLFAQWEYAEGLVTRSRSLKHFSKVSAMEQPALYQFQTGEDIRPRRGFPPQYTLKVELVLYVWTDDGEAPASTQINRLVDQFFRILNPAADEPTLTLGIPGVQHVWIEGEVDIAEAIVDRQSIVVIPVRVLTV